MRAIHGLGVERCDSYVLDGHSEYFGQSGYKVVSPTVHEILIVVETSQRDMFLSHLRQHEAGKTTYLELSKGLAQSGIEKWTIDIVVMTVTFFDKAGREMLVEHIS